MLLPPQFCKPALSLSRNKTELERSPSHWCDPKATPRKAPLFLPLSSPQAAVWLLADGAGTTRVEHHLSCHNCQPSRANKSKNLLCIWRGSARCQGLPSTRPRAAEHTVPLAHPALHWGSSILPGAQLQKEESDVRSTPGKPSFPFPAFDTKKCRNHRNQNSKGLII